MSRAAEHNAGEALFIPQAVTAHHKAAHAVTQQVDRNIGILRDGHIHDHIGIVQNLVEGAVVGQVALGTAMTAVVKAIGTITGSVELFHKVVITALMLTQAVDNYHDGLVVGSGFGLHIQLGSVEGRNHLFCGGAVAAVDANLKI